MTRTVRFVARVAVLVALVAGTPVQTQTPEIDALRERAEQGDAEAQYDLGDMYRSGRGVEQDDVQAYLWYELAASREHAFGARSRDRTANRLTPEQVAEAQRLAREWDEAHPR